MSHSNPNARDRSRAALSNRPSRYAPIAVETDAEAAWETPARITECSPETARTIISRNQSPDVPFEQSINPYRGCEHGCVYCYARPTHAWLDLSPGLDFETRLTFKHNATEQLAHELRKPGYRCSPITIGANTDPYQPVEKRHALTRSLLEVMLEFRHPVSVITKGQLIDRDIDLLSELAALDLCSVAVSVTTLDRDLKRRMEPRAASPEARLSSIAALHEAGVPVSVLFAPVIPALNDCEMERVLEASAAAGARSAAYILLRLPLEISELFREWLQEHYPLRAGHVMSVLRQCRGNRDYDRRFGHRMRGLGPFADLLETRFDQACRRHGLSRRDAGTLDCSQFRVPPAAGDQLGLF